MILRKLRRIDVEKPTDLKLSISVLVLYFVLIC